MSPETMAEARRLIAAFEARQGRALAGIRLGKTAAVTELGQALMREASARGVAVELDGTEPN